MKATLVETLRFVLFVDVPAILRSPFLIRFAKWRNLSKFAHIVFSLSKVKVSACTVVQVSSRKLALLLCDGLVNFTLEELCQPTSIG